MVYEIKDSGERQAFGTGAVRDTQAGKGRFDLIPPEVEAALAVHFEAGCQKYGDRNWEKGIPLGRYLDSARRHLNKWQRGLRDENHLIAAVWNLVCLYATAERIRAGRLPRSLDDNGYLGPEWEGCSTCAPGDCKGHEEAPYGHVLPDPEPAPTPEEVQRRNQREEAAEAAKALAAGGPTLDFYYEQMRLRGFDAIDAFHAAADAGFVRWRYRNHPDTTFIGPRDSIARPREAEVIG